jgi:hypothetical protein
MSTNALGTDFYCADDVTEDLAIESDPRAAYLQAMYRRLTVSGLFYSDNYGLGVHRFILETGLTDLELRDAIRAELLKDERTRDVKVTLSENAITIVCIPHNAASFPLTLTIDRVSGALITGES